MPKMMLSALTGLIVAGASIASARAEPAVGPSFSCTRTTAALDPAGARIERTICADPALAALDLALDGAFHDTVARDPDGKPDLLNTQRAWLKARVSSCPAGSTPKAFTDCLGDEYRDRLAALRAHDARDAAVCRAVAKRVRQAAGYLASYSLGEALRNDPASPVSLGEGEAVTDALVAKLPNKDDLDLDMKAGRVDLFHFGAIRSLVATNSVQGTLHCQEIWLYKIVKGGAFVALDPPEHRESDCGGSTYFGSAADPANLKAPAALYIVEASTIDGSSLDVTSRRDDAWHPACTVATSFATQLAVSRRFCAKGADCDTLASKALDLARQRDAAGRDAPMRLGAASFNADKIVHEQVELPIFDAKDDAAWSSFEYNAPVYEIAGPNGPLAMRISHGMVGWRTNEDWLVAVYDRKGAELAGVMIQKSRTRLRDVSIR